MKRFLLIVLATAILTSCGKDEPKIESFVFSGKIDNFRKRNMTLEGFNFSKKIKFDRKTKTFKDTLKNMAPGHYTLFVGKRPIHMYFTPNEDVNVSVDAKKRTKKPTFIGNNSNINNYLEKRKNKFGLLLGNYQKFFAKKEDEFLAKNEKYTDALLKLAESSQLPPEYLELEKRNIDYEGVRNQYNYERLHRILTGDDEFKSKDDLKTVIDDVDLNSSTDYINSRQYRNLLKEYLEDVAGTKTTEDGDYYLTYLETIQTEVTDTLVKNNLIHDISEKALTYTTNLSEFYRKYMGYSTNEKNKREITEVYNQLKLTEAGQPSPKFENYDSYDGKKVSLDDLLNKGKYLYIDIWATWCSFCKKEIPLLKNFEVKYHGKNIEFVSISVDKRSDFNKWKRMVEENEMGGVQLFAGEGTKTLQFAKDYVIKGLPRFILLDPEGKIVSANAPRPSDGDRLDAIFEELGIETH